MGIPKPTNDLFKFLETKTLLLNLVIIRLIFNSFYVSHYFMYKYSMMVEMDVKNNTQLFFEEI